MKLGFLMLALFTIIYPKENFKKVLCAHSWKVEYIKIINGTNDPNSSLPISVIDSAPPLCGQIITFIEDSTCKVEKKGKGWWSEIDKFNWHLDNSGNLVFRNKGIRFQNGFSLLLLRFNKDSIILYEPARGIESSELMVTVHILKKIKVNRAQK